MTSRIKKVLGCTLGVTLLTRTVLTNPLQKLEGVVGFNIDSLQLGSHMLEDKMLQSLLLSNFEPEIESIAGQQPTTGLEKAYKKLHQKQALERQQGKQEKTILELREDYKEIDSILGNNIDEDISNSDSSSVPIRPEIDNN